MSNEKVKRRRLVENIEIYKVNTRKRAASVANTEKILAELGPDVLATRPKTRQDCLPGGSNAQRPCPWVSCEHHPLVDINIKSGSIESPYPELFSIEDGIPVIDWEKAQFSCVLDFVDQHAHGVALEEVAASLQMTRENVRWIENAGLRQLRLFFIDDVPLKTRADGVELKKKFYELGKECVKERRKRSVVAHIEEGTLCSNCNTREAMIPKKRVAPEFVGLCRECRTELAKASVRKRREGFYGD